MQPLIPCSSFFSSSATFLCLAYGGSQDFVTSDELSSSFSSPTNYLRPMTATLLLLLLLRLSPLSSAAAGTPAGITEAVALLQFKKSLSNPSSLSSWAPGTTPCDTDAQWACVICLNGNVAGLRLDQLGLSGPLDLSPLRELRGLRSLSLAFNSFTGPLPPAIAVLTSLRAIFLQGNRFSGAIPSDLFSKLTRLRKLWLSGNELSGPIPVSLSQVSGLLELRLEGNRFTGQIPDLVSLKELESFNVSQNALEGRVPHLLGRFGASAFSGNPGLCGAPFLNRPCSPRPEEIGPKSNENNNSVPWGPAVAPPPPKLDGSRFVITALASLVGCAVVWWIVILFKRREQNTQTLGHKKDDTNKPINITPTGPAHHATRNAEPSRKQVVPEQTGNEAGYGKGNPGDLVMVNESKGVIGLSDLMKAAAEVLGNGGLGSAYKAVMGGGMAVVVKRMRDMNRAGREGFEAEMRRLGRMNHANVLPPLAYHYRKDEKLVVSEFVPKGSLLYVLHGDRGADHAALDWPTRLKIIVGVARGLGYIHAELASLDIPHGNLKSGNVLLDLDFNPLIVDYGYMGLINPSQASQTMSAYKSPEALQLRHVSPKSDVYCFGIIILEILTGKFPSQYLNNTRGGTDVILWANTVVGENREVELLDPAIVNGKPAIEDMQRLVQLGLACVEPDPSLRVDMKEAVRQVEEIVAAATGRSDGSELRNRHEAYVREAAGERSARRLGSIGQRSTRKSEDNTSFEIS